MFGWPRNCYSDNGSHFTSAALAEDFDEYGVNHVLAPVSHPYSVGMIERAVQMVLALTRRSTSLQPERAKEWGILLMDGLSALNGRMVKVHGYMPAEIMMGFNPRRAHYQLENTRLAMCDDFTLEEPLPPHLAQLHSMLHNETRKWLIEAFAVSNAAVKQENKTGCLAGSAAIFGKVIWFSCVTSRERRTGGVKLNPAGRARRFSSPLTLGEGQLWCECSTVQGLSVPVLHRYCRCS